MSSKPILSKRLKQLLSSQQQSPYAITIDQIKSSTLLSPHDQITENERGKTSDDIVYNANSNISENSKIVTNNNTINISIGPSFSQKPYQNQLDESSSSNSNRYKAQKIANNETYMYMKNRTETENNNNNSSRDNVEFTKNKSYFTSIDQISESIGDHVVYLESNSKKQYSSVQSEHEVKSNKQNNNNSTNLPNYDSSPILKPFCTPNFLSRDQHNLNSKTQNKLEESDTSSSKLVNFKCLKHKNHIIMSICTKEYCGELLCSQCISQHIKINHIGTYKPINEFLSLYKLDIETEQGKQKELLKRISSHLQQLKSDNISLKENNLISMLNNLENNIINSIRQYFQQLKKINKNDNLQKDIIDLTNRLEALNSKVEDNVKNIGKDLQLWNELSNENLYKISSLFKQNNSSPCIFKQFMDEIEEFEPKISHSHEVFDKINQEGKIMIDMFNINHDFEKKLHEFLACNIFKRNDKLNTPPKTNKLLENSNSNDLKMIMEKSSEQASSSGKSEPSSPKEKNEDILLYYQNLYQNDQNNIQIDNQKAGNNQKQGTKPNSQKQIQEETKRSLKALTPNENLIIDTKKLPSNVLQIQQQQQQQQLIQQKQNSPKQQPLVASYYNNGQQQHQSIKLSLKRAKTISPPKSIKQIDQGFEKSTKGIISPNKAIVSQTNFNSNTPEHQSTLFHDKDIDPPRMQIALNALCEYFQSQKIKIFDSSFLLHLFKISCISNPEDLDPSLVQYENVREYLTIRNGKHKCIFHSYEKLFFPIYINNQQWILIEIRTNPRNIIAYEPMNKSTLKNKYLENILNVYQELIRLDYKDKLNQTPDFVNQWEKKVSLGPCLVVKNLHDTGIVIIKIISNAYQHKEFSNANISIIEINIIRKKLEKFFKFQDDHYSNEKYLPF